MFSVNARNNGAEFICGWQRMKNGGRNIERERQKKLSTKRKYGFFLETAVIIDYLPEILCVSLRFVTTDRSWSACAVH